MDPPTKVIYWGGEGGGLLLGGEIIYIYIYIHTNIHTLGVTGVNIGCRHCCSAAFGPCPWPRGRSETPAAAAPVVVTITIKSTVPVAVVNHIVVIIISMLKLIIVVIVHIDTSIMKSAVNSPCSPRSVVMTSLTHSLTHWHNILYYTILY